MPLIHFVVSDVLLKAIIFPMSDCRYVQMCTVYSSFASYTLRAFRFQSLQQTLLIILYERDILVWMWPTTNEHVETVFTARRFARAVLATAIPSVRPSVTRRYVKTTARSTVQFALSDGKMCIVL